MGDTFWLAQKKSVCSFSLIGIDSFVGLAEARRIDRGILRLLLLLLFTIRSKFICLFICVRLFVHAYVSICAFIYN